MLDCDGVLFDSIRSNVAYYDAILERMGDPPLDEEARRLCHVYSTPQLFAHLYADDPEKAKPFLEKAVRLEPDAGTAFRCLGDALSALGNTEGAISAYKSSVKLNPNGIPRSSNSRYCAENCKKRSHARTRPRSMPITWRFVSGSRPRSTMPHSRRR
jgi:tetratricopeptide (TPR) repeat protein